MEFTRRAWLTTMAAAVVARHAQENVPARAARLVQAYSDQGVHRTGTTVDALSAEWLSREVASLGPSPSRETFTLNRVDVVSTFVEAGGRRIEGLPLFDAAFTGANGVRGRLGSTVDSEVPLLDLAPNTAGSGSVGEARRRNAARAIVCVTRAGRPGLCPSNADSFTAPFGPPVVQVSSDEGAWLSERASEGAAVRVVADVKRTAVDAFNVTAAISGRDRTLPPLVVMTPRSGWYTCASERGGGIVCWLEVMRAMQNLPVSRRPRDVVFVASSGHELGHLGINAFVQRRPGIVKNSIAWMHFGANIAAAAEPAQSVQSSDDESEAILTRAMTAANLTVDRRVPRGTVPGGEAEVVHRGGGRYVSLIGRNALFHNPADKGAGVVDAGVLARFVDATISVATSLIAS